MTWAAGKNASALDDSELRDVIAWTSSGSTFVIKDEHTFARDVLPKLYKHNNFGSFVRQLNKYDFHKVRTVPSGACHPVTPRHLTATRAGSDSASGGADVFARPRRSRRRRVSSSTVQTHGNSGTLILRAQRRAC